MIKGFYAIFLFDAAIVIFGLILAYLPTESKIKTREIAPEVAARLRQQYKGPHNQFTTTDGYTLFLRRWNPDRIEPAKKDIAVLIFPGLTAYSGLYSMANEPISAGGYTTFGLDYRGHGLSDGNRGDSPGKDRWIVDLAQSVKYIKELGFRKVIILGHSLGVAFAMCAMDAIPNEISGLILLSGAYEGRKELSKPPTLFQGVKFWQVLFFALRIRLLNIIGKA